MTALSLAQRALAEIGTRTTITAIDTSTPEGTYIGLLYGPLRDFLLREGDYDWALAVNTTPVSAGAASFPWHFSYEYPAGALRIRQLIPAQETEDYPRPMSWNVVANGTDQLILTQIEIVTILYTLAPDESVWDSIFQESFVRLLASCLAFALENRIEASNKALNEAISFAGIANLRDS